MSLFDDTGMRKGQKSTLYDIFKQKYDLYDMINKNENYTFIIDGGMLWQKHHTFRDILEQYTYSLHYNFGVDIVVVFYGYTGNSTKTAERLCRKYKQSSVDIVFIQDNNPRQIFIKHKQ